MQPILFTPQPFYRIWGGRAIETYFGKALPNDQEPYGESWEISDRPECDSIIFSGKYAGQSLHKLWSEHRETIFGKGYENLETFPLLCKILDCNQNLSVQVHPPKDVAESLGGDSKTEIWYVAEAEKGSSLYSGWKQNYTLDEVRTALNNGSVDQLICQLHPKKGDSLFIPSGRIHALGSGLIIYEIQENSNTTYRLFDWNRKDAQGNPRELHIEESLQSINLNDVCPTLKTTQHNQETLVQAKEFNLIQYSLEKNDSFLPQDNNHFSVLVIAEGSLSWGETTVGKGTFLLLPKHVTQAIVTSDKATLLVANVQPNL